MKWVAVKRLYQSKQIWINFLALIGLILQEYTGSEVLPVATQAIILTIINIILRVTTRTPIAFSADDAFVQVVEYLKIIGVRVETDTLAAIRAQIARIFKK